MTFVLPQGFRQLPPVWEIAQPFQVDGNGTIAFDTDPVQWVRNHILALLLTIPGERVMRPNYGIGIYSLVFQNADPLIEQQIISAVNIGVNMWEKNVNIIECKFAQTPDYSGILELDISFTVGSSPTVHSVGFTLGGSTVELSQ